jgi:hypothetical protein
LFFISPLYWYPSVYQRDIRSALAPSIYESSEYPAPYPVIENSEIPGKDFTLLFDFIILI